MPGGIDYLTPSDWKGLASADVTKYVKREGASVLTFDYTKLDLVLVKSLKDSALIESVDEFAEKGLTLGEIVYNRLNLPNVSRVPPVDKRTGLADEDWVHPVQAVSEVVARRLRQSHKGSVQSIVLKDGLILFSANKMVEINFDGDLRNMEKRRAYALTSSVPVIQKFVTGPDMAESVKKAELSLAHWGALTDAVPEAAGSILEALSAEAEVLMARREEIFAHVTAAMTSEQRAALEAEVSKLAGEREPVNLSGVLALPSGSATSTDAAA